MFLATSLLPALGHEPTTAENWFMIVMFIIAALLFIALVLSLRSETAIKQPQCPEKK